MNIDIKGIVAQYLEEKTYNNKLSQKRKTEKKIRKESILKNFVQERRIQKRKEIDKKLPITRKKGVKKLINKNTKANIKKADIKDEIDDDNVMCISEYVEKKIKLAKKKDLDCQNEKICMETKINSDLHLKLEGIQNIKNTEPQNLDLEKENIHIAQNNLENFEDIKVKKCVNAKIMIKRRVNTKKKFKNANKEVIDQNEENSGLVIDENVKIEDKNRRQSALIARKQVVKGNKILNERISSKKIKVTVRKQKPITYQGVLKRKKAEEIKNNSKSKIHGKNKSNEIGDKNEETKAVEKQKIDTNEKDIKNCYLDNIKDASLNLSRDNVREDDLIVHKEPENVFNTPSPITMKFTNENIKINELLTRLKNDFVQNEKPVISIDKCSKESSKLIFAKPTFTNKGEISSESVQRNVVHLIPKPTLIFDRNEFSRHEELTPVKKDFFTRRNLLKKVLEDDKKRTPMKSKENDDPNQYVPRMKIPEIDQNDKVESSFVIKNWTKDPQLKSFVSKQNQDEIEKVFSSKNDIDLTKIFPNNNSVTNDSPNKWPTNRREI